MNLICGINPVLEALAAGTRHFDRLLVVKGIRNRRVSEAMARAGQMGVPLRFEARETLDRMAGGLVHQGVIAVVSPKPVVSVEDVLREAHDPALLLLLDGVEDPRNLGAILRSAEAAGADGVLLPERHSAGLSDAVARTSAGALEHVKVARIGNVSQAIEALKARGVWVVGFDATGNERWDAVDYRRPLAVVLGGEGRGIRRLVREKCDHVVSLPLFGHVSSLNVSVVAGIALYEIIRQRGAVPSHVRPIPLRRWNPPLPDVGPSADDGEHDPGDGEREPPSSDEGPEEGAAEGDAQVSFDGLHDDVAWSGPTVITRHEGRRDRRHPPRREGRPFQTRTPVGQGGPPGGEAPARSREGRGRRRRRRPRRDGPPSSGPPVEPGTPPPSPEGSSGGGVPSATGAGSGHRRRRRRRRRR
jgi:23S rRNA (guanosine2251-2'-O)-methyltransferase